MYSCGLRSSSILGSGKDEGDDDCILLLHAYRRYTHPALALATVDVNVDGLPFTFRLALSASSIILL